MLRIRSFSNKYSNYCFYFCTSPLNNFLEILTLKADSTEMPELSSLVSPSNLPKYEVLAGYFQSGAFFT